MTVKPDEYRRCTNSSCRFVCYADDTGPGLACPRCGYRTEDPADDRKTEKQSSR